MNSHIVEVKGYKFHVIVDGSYYKIIPEGKPWYSSAIAKENPLETAINDIKENFIFYVS